MMKRWSEDQTYQFVKLYLQHQLLWDTTHDDYRLRDKRFKAHREVIADFRAKTGIVINVGQLITKVKNLKSTYAQEKCKIKQRSNSEWTYKPTIKWFSIWHRCMSQLSESADGEPIVTDESTDTTNPNSCQKVWLTQSDGSHSEVSTQEDYNLLILEPKSETQDNSIIPPYKIKKQQLKHHNRSSDYTDNTFRGSMSSFEGRNGNNLNSKDEFDIFGMYIASQLRQIDIQKALKVKLQIHRLVSEARISEIEDI